MQTERPHQTGEGSGAQADIAVQVVLFPGVVPPALVRETLQKATGRPLQEAADGGAADKPEEPALVQLAPQQGDKNGEKTVITAHGSGENTAVYQVAAAEGRQNGF